MKKRCMNFCSNFIKKNNPSLSDEKLEEIIYGLEGIYLTITKTIVIFGLTLLFGIFKEMLIMLLVFNVLRTTAFGLHAKKSWHCWTFSITLFILFPFISKFFIIPDVIKLILGVISIILMFIYAPADTHKHPLINKKKKRLWKTFSTINCIILVILTFIIKNETICNLIFFGIYTEVILINPLTYKILNLPYNNYTKYTGLNSNV